MHDSTPRSPLPPLWLAFGLAALVGTALAWRISGAGLWPASLIPLGGAAFAALWVRAGGRIGWAAALVLWVPGLALAMWLPFVMQSYLMGDGPGQGGAVFGAFVTAAAVGWYVLGSHPWAFLAGGLALLALLALWRAARGARP